MFLLNYTFIVVISYYNFHIMWETFSLSCFFIRLSQILKCGKEFEKLTTNVKYI